VDGDACQESLSFLWQAAYQSLSIVDMRLTETTVLAAQNGCREACGRVADACLFALGIAWCVNVAAHHPIPVRAFLRFNSL